MQTHTHTRVSPAAHKEGGVFLYVMFFFVWFYKWVEQKAFYVKHFFVFLSVVFSDIYLRLGEWGFFYCVLVSYCFLGD